ncbi:MAG TPA: hypothetical protein GX729_06585 [Firmicutes bacterium]|nr:hypothetical protein [Bacillota bacterium]
MTGLTDSNPMTAKLMSPEEFLGFTPGDDRRLADWTRITGYFRHLSQYGRRTKWFDMGKTTEGRPFYYIVISSPETLDNLEEFRAINARLAYPRGLGEQEAEGLIARGKTVVMLSCSIHATEVGAAQMSMELAYELETSQDPEVIEILGNVILLLVPSLNPDGLDLVVDWYEKYLDTPYEGSAPPFLYHKYAGHDNNRDWFMLNLVENRLTVEKIHNVWHPQIVFDMHQMGDSGFRFFVPPYVDPYDPNVDFILQQQINMLGTHIVGELLSAGKTGVSCYNGFDAYAPSRAYQHYHGGVRILSEASSVKLGTPITKDAKELRVTRDGWDPRQSTWNHPVPWPGGEWRLRDIVEYEKIAAMACLRHAAAFRELWLSNFYKIGVRACERKEPFAFILPTNQRDPVMLYELLKVLHMGQVELHRARSDFEVEGAFFPAGSFVIKLAQPYGAYAKTLLEIQEYPDLRQYPGGPPKLPYDITGHTLPLLMGVKCTLAKKPFDADLERVDGPELPQGKIRVADGTAHGPSAPEGEGIREEAGRGMPMESGSVKMPGRTGSRDEPGGIGYQPGSGGGSGWYVLSPAVNASCKVVNALLQESRKVYRTAASLAHGGLHLPAGSFLVPSDAVEAVELEMLCRRFGVDAWFVDGMEGSGDSGDSAAQDAFRGTVYRLQKPRVGVYQAYRPVADEGWLRYVLEEYGFPYETVRNRRIKHGNLGEEFDTIIFPSMGAKLIAEGVAEGTYPPEYTGGLGSEGKEAIAAFVEAGGTCVFLDASCQWAIKELGLPAVNVLDGKQPPEFFAPGSILRTIVDTEHPLGYGLPRETAVMFAGSPAWEAEAQHVVARYPAVVPVMSGWLLGGGLLANKASLLEIPVGYGRVVLVGFHPHFRAQARGTYKVVFNAIYLGSSKKV